MPIVKIILIVMLPISILLSNIFYKKYAHIKQDNIVEEFVEDVIKNQTGITIDLTPSTIEMVDERTEDYTIVSDDDLKDLLGNDYDDFIHSLIITEDKDDNIKSDDKELDLGNTVVIDPEEDDGTTK